MKEKIIDSIKESIKVKDSLLAVEVINIEKAVKMIIGSLKSGGKLLICGNGGSAADSQHIAAELVGRFKRERKAIAAIALTANTSILTAIANDYGYDVTFARQVEALARPCDVLLGISTSGNSKNVLAAIDKAREIGCKVIGLLGGEGGAIKKKCDIAITVASKDTPRVQESHILIGHILCELIEEGRAG